MSETLHSNHEKKRGNYMYKFMFFSFVVKLLTIFGFCDANKYKASHKKKIRIKSIKNKLHSFIDENRKKFFFKKKLKLLILSFQEAEKLI